MSPLAVSLLTVGSPVVLGIDCSNHASRPDDGCIRSQQLSHVDQHFLETVMTKAMRAFRAVSSIDRRSLQEDSFIDGDHPEDRPAVVFGLVVIIALLVMAYGSTVGFCICHTKSRRRASMEIRRRSQMGQTAYASDANRAAAGDGVTLSVPAVQVKPASQAVTRAVPNNPAMPPPRATPQAGTGADGFGLLDDMKGMMGAAAAPQPGAASASGSPPPPPAGMNRFEYKTWQ